MKNRIMSNNLQFLLTHQKTTFFQLNLSFPQIIEKNNYYFYIWNDLRPPMEATLFLIIVVPLVFLNLAKTLSFIFIPLMFTLLSHYCSCRSCVG